MKILIHDRVSELPDDLKGKYGLVICADGKYAPCQGCFKCWTKHPASCELKDSLHEISKVLGQADELDILTENLYGGYSPQVKNLIDRAIGLSTPMSTYRGKQMHHTLRYGMHDKLRVFVTGDVSGAEKDTWKLMIERNALNWGFREYEVAFAAPEDDLSEVIL